MAQPSFQPTTMDFAAIAREWIEVWNCHDLDRIMAHYADDVELVSPIAIKLMDCSDGTVRRRAGLRDYFARGLETYPALQFSFIRIYPGVRSCVLEYRSLNDSVSAKLMEFDNKGHIVRVLAHYSGLEPNANA